MEEFKKIIQDNQNKYDIPEFKIEKELLPLLYCHGSFYIAMSQTHFILKNPFIGQLIKKEVGDGARLLTAKFIDYFFDIYLANADEYGKKLSLDVDKEFIARIFTTENLEKVYDEWERIMDELENEKFVSLFIVLHKIFGMVDIPFTLILCYIEYMSKPMENSYVIELVERMIEKNLDKFKEELVKLIDKVIIEKVNYVKKVIRENEEQDKEK